VSRDRAEVGIVGAGPAGARAAELLARRGADVVLLDPKAPWEKPCGGGLTPSLFDEIPELKDVWPLAREVHRARIELDAETGFDTGLDVPLRIISREALGRWQLARALQAGARHLAVRVGRIERTRDGWLLESGADRLEVSTLLGADGAASTVRAAVAAALPVELVPARVTYPRRGGAWPDVVVLRFFPDVVGYLWDFPRLDHRSVGIEASRGPHTRSDLDRRIDAYRETEPTEDAPRTGAVIGTTRHGHGDFSHIAGHGFALLGDAAGFADPFTGEGIRNALRSADLFAEAWAMGTDWPTTYPTLARRAFAREMAVARLFRRTLSESGLGVKLVEWAVRSRLAYAFVTTTLNTASEHAYAPRRLLRLFSHALRSRPVTA
jgi:flavin-dependent dehydrogenase